MRACGRPQFWTLRYVDAATYQILGNLKIVTTGVLLWACLRRPLSLLQGLALVLLMIGATISQVQAELCSHHLCQMQGSVSSGPRRRCLAAAVELLRSVQCSDVSFACLVLL